MAGISGYEGSEIAAAGQRWRRMSSACVPDVVALDSPDAVDPALTGAKAANLADASARGPPVLPGFVVTTGATVGGELARRAIVPLSAAWRSLELAAIERRGQAPSVDRSTMVLDHLRSTPVDRPNPFGWLTSTSSRGTGVFVPVLLGAGVVLSAIAYVVERIAEATAMPLLDRRLARRYESIAPPANGLLGGPPTRHTTATRRRAPGRMIATALAAAAIVVIGWLGVQTLIEATQTRPDPAARPARTTIELAMAQRGTGDGATEAAEALWVGCRSTLGSLPTTANVVGIGGERVALVLEPGIGRLRARRLTGCLSDLRVSLVRARVLDVHSGSSASGQSARPLPGCQHRRDR